MMYTPREGDDDTAAGGVSVDEVHLADGAGTSSPNVELQTSTVEEQQRQQHYIDAVRFSHGMKYHIVRNNCNHFSTFAANVLIPCGYLLAPSASPKSLVFDSGAREVRTVLFRPDDRSVLLIPLKPPAKSSAPPQQPTVRLSAKLPEESHPNTTLVRVEHREVRQLVPSWVNRLSTLGVTWLSKEWVEAIEAADRAAQGG